MDGLKKSFKSLKWYEWLMIIIMIVIAGISVYNAFSNPAKSSNPPWLTIINFISAICGIICIFFCAKASISSYIFGLINTIVYAIFLVYHKIWGTLGLELFIYLPFNLSGWYVWAKHRDKVETEKTTARKLKTSQNILSAIAVLAIGGLCYWILNKLDGTTPLLDAFVTSMGIVATYLQLFRFREQYVWWLIQDIIAVAMYVVAFDPVYLTKKSIYMVMSIIGLINWWKLNKERNSINE